MSHCGAGCTLGDIIAEFAAFGLGATAGFFTAWPVNAWLIRTGIKEAM